MTPAEACKAKKDYFQEELLQSRQFHSQTLQRYRDDQQNDQQSLVGQRKDPSTHPSKPQELKNPSTYPSAPVSAQSVKADSVISRGTPFPLRQNLSSIKPLF